VRYKSARYTTLPPCCKPMARSGAIFPPPDAPFFSARWRAKKHRHRTLYFAARERGANNKQTQVCIEQDQTTI
jgi:hypothetical protein